MKRTTTVLIVTLFLLAAGYFIFLQSQRVEDNIFHIEDTSLVESIEIEKVAKGSIVENVQMAKQETGWQLNGKYSVAPQKIESFLQTLTKIRVKTPIEKKAQKSALSLLKKSHIRVKVSGENGILKEYLIGTTNSKHTANVMMVQGASKAYMVSKPGMNGYVSILYATDPLSWRERTLIDLQPQQLKRIQVAYPTSEESGFNLRRGSDGGAWMVSEGALASLDRVDSYLNNFKNKVSAESFANEAFPEMRDSLKGRSPDVSFQVESLDGKKFNLLLFSRPDNPNNFFGYFEGEQDLYTIQHFVIDKFLKRGGYFANSAL